MKKIAVLFLALGACVEAPTTTQATSHVATLEVVHVLSNAFDPDPELLSPYVNADGGHPRGPVFEFEGRLYGTGWQNGPNMGGDIDHSCSSNFYWQTEVQDYQCPGSLFSMALDGSDFRVEHAFSRLNSSKRNADGYQPSGELAAFGGRIYGTTRAGGNLTGLTSQPGCGTLYSMVPGDSSSFVVHHSFCSYARHADGRSPHGGVTIAPDGTVYGTSITGNDGAGVIWKYPPGGPLANVATFPKVSGVAALGSTPYGTVIIGADGKLHGATGWGGANNAGTLYTVDPVTRAITADAHWPAYTFAFNTDNSGLQALELGDDGTIYGASQFGGPNGNGFSFKFEDGQVEILLENAPVYQTSSPGCPRYCNDTGSLPISSPVEGEDGLLYWTTTSGGEFGHGGIFRGSRDGALFQELHSFTLEDPIGYHPHAGLIQGSDGAFYGTTFGGGAGGGFGVVFRMVPPQFCP